MFLVYDKNMNLLTFPDGVKPLDIFISSIQKERVSEKVEGVHGSINKGFTYGSRDVELKLLLKARDAKDYRLLRDEVFAMFRRGELYISEEYQKGKRYLISPDEPFIPERFDNNRRLATANINCNMPSLPFAESIGKTQDIQRAGIVNEELWGHGMGLLDDSLVYTVTATSFNIFNAGTEPIHPFQQDLKITISQVAGSTSFLQLKNNTNGTIFKANKAVSNSEKLVIDGPRVTSNSLEYLRDTNKTFIQLDPGWNSFSLTGATSAKIEFDFRFYYS
ncbi:phage tail domain-containing protein [Fictibacillus fluitans]|uniref:Phage tail family protein n=1 Tax=Fictibacillus fluitans TaxID=3058422 RepID=A0ABT8HYI4_9BACL|nr:phage tail domain-containing protein [Fictibacillus sp. NE201]MDN4525317.1 phage tail family protein [Fictibacillus sp. NE201]